MDSKENGVDSTVGNHVPSLFGSTTNNPCAYCWKHAAYMTVHQLRKKQCLKKQCRALQRNLKHKYWIDRENVRTNKEKHNDEKAEIIAKALKNNNEKYK